MKAAGFLLMLAGWMIVLATVALLGGATARTGVAAFVLAGVAVEALGLVLFARSHLARRGESR